MTPFQPVLAGFLAMSCVSTGAASLTFLAADVLHEVGGYHRSYRSSSVGMESFRVGGPGEGQRWDFSHPREARESIQRMDVVSPSQAGHVAAFPDAGYVERLTDETSRAQSLSYYRVTEDEGRLYYGFHDAVSNPECPLKVFDAVTPDLPPRMVFGQSWVRSADFSDCVDAGFLVVELGIHYTSRSEVDASGTVILPNLGELPALRVNEVSTYQVTDLTLGIFGSVRHFRSYSWLVSGIGSVVRVTSAGDLAIPPPDFTNAGSVLRVFEVRPWPVSDLQIFHQAGQARLNWRKEANAVGYRVESRNHAAAGDWRLHAEADDNVWSDPLAPGEFSRFFRVMIKP